MRKCHPVVYDSKKVAFTRYAPYSKRLGVKDPKLNGKIADFVLVPVSLPLCTVTMVVYRLPYGCLD